MVFSPEFRVLPCFPGALLGWTHQYDQGMNYKKIRLRAYQILEKARSGDTTSIICDISILSLIALNLLMIMLQTIDTVAQTYQHAFWLFEVFSVIVFTFEYILRLWVSVESNNKGEPFQKRLKYAVSATAIIDLLAILPFYIAFLPINDMRFLRTLRLLRVLRIFKIGRYSNSLGTMVRVFKRKKDDLLISLAMVGISLIVVSTIMFHIENSAQPEAFSNIFQSLWWGIITVTGVGYGDTVPITIAGRVLGAAIAVLGILTIALPIGILGSAYVEDMENRSKGRIRAIRSVGHTIICGFNRNTRKIAEDLEPFNDENKIIIVTMQPNPEIPGVIYVNADWSDFDVLEQINISQASVCVIVAEDFGEHAMESNSGIVDMRGIFTLYKIKLKYPNVHTITEIINPDKLEMVRSNIRADEIILKETIDGNLVANCIKVPNVSSMIYELVNREGKTIGETSLRELGLPDPSTYGDVIRHGIDTDITFIGHISDRTSRSQLSPRKTTVVEVDDRLIYVTDNPERTA